MLPNHVQYIYTERLKISPFFSSWDLEGVEKKTESQTTLAQGFQIGSMDKYQRL
jgi:hypothetical protein